VLICREKSEGYPPAGLNGFTPFYHGLSSHFTTLPQEQVAPKVKFSAFPVWKDIAREALNLRPSAGYECNSIWRMNGVAE
jgi:hypothetical protein